MSIEKTFIQNISNSAKKQAKDVQTRIVSFSAEKTTKFLEKAERFHTRTKSSISKAKRKELSASRVNKWLILSITF